MVLKSEEKNVSRLTVKIAIKAKNISIFFSITRIQVLVSLISAVDSFLKLS